MNFINDIHNVKMDNSGSIALLHERTSRQQDYNSLPKWDGKQTSVLRPQGQTKNSPSHISYSKIPSVPARSCGASWLNTFLHKSARYADFLAMEEARNKTNPTSPTLPSTPALSTNDGASTYTQMRRSSLRSLLNRSSEENPFSLEWALDELLMVDKWLDEKYGSTSERKDAVAVQTGGSSGEAGGYNYCTTLGVPGRVGDDRPVLVPAAAPRDRRTRRIENLSHETHRKESCYKHHSNTMPHNIQELFAVDNWKTPSTCSLPDSASMEVVGRVLAAEV